MMKRATITIALLSLLAPAAFAQTKPSVQPQTLQLAKPLFKKVELESKVKIERVFDRTLLVSKSVRKSQRAKLIKMGFRKVKKRSQIEHHTLFEGRAFFEYSVAQSAPSDRDLKKLNGQPVRLQLKQLLRGTPVVVGVKR